MHLTVKALQAYHKALGLEVGLFHLDPFWHSHHPDGHCDGVTASNWSHSSFHWPDGLGNQGFPGTRWQMLYMLLAGPTFPTDLPGGNVYQKEFTMEAQDLSTVVGGSGANCCGQNAQVVASESHAFWDKVLGEVRCSFSDRNFHSRMPLIPTLKRAGVWSMAFVHSAVGGRVHG